MGTVFNIQHYSVEDGPGIRTVVFLKGCPLHCAWCANPESQRREPELAWSKRECIGCRECVEELSGYGCRFREGQGLFWNEDVSPDADKVGAVCPSTALHVIGEEVSVDEVMEIVRRDMVFYQNSMGGITLSGGEPLLQREFAIDLLKQAKREHIHTAIETCGYVAQEVFLEAAAYLDYMNMDIKAMDDAVHQRATGVSNERILSNLLAVKKNYPDLPVNVRTPVVPGYNDNAEELQRIYDFIKDLPNVTYEPLKYHRLGLPKYESLHRRYPMGDAELSAERFEALRQGIQRE